MRIPDRPSIFLALTLSLLAGRPLLLECQEKPSRSTAHTTVRLVSNAKSIRPGHTLMVGVLMTMERGWHTYWKNSGEAGLPTTLAWTVPPGIDPGEIEWPLPEKHIEAGDVLTYGYADETMLEVPLKVSQSFAGERAVTLRVKVSWLECEHICVPGEADAMLTLPVSNSPQEADNTELFERFHRRIPGPATSLTGVAISSTTDSAAVLIRLAPTGDRSLSMDGEERPDVYPETLSGLIFARTTTLAKGQGAEIRLPLSVFEKVPGPLTLRGVLVCSLKGSARQAVKIEIPLSAEFCSGLRPDAQNGAPGSVLDHIVVAGRSGPAPSILLYLLFALIGGLLLNIMPCVLPVIALKIFGLVRMASDNPATIRRLGWMFSLGILASFLLLAVVVIALQAAGQQVGWGFQFQEPLFVIAMSAIVFGFGLSLFGVYEIRLPGAAVNTVSAAVAGQASAGNGYVASFSEGVFATILATPCTAPFLGTALGFAFAEPWWIILLIFSTVALGMALPYLLLTSRPAWVRYLPKPGSWMVAAKEFMGFLMMATLLWLLYVLGKQLGMEGVIWTSAFLLTVGIACWLVGRFATLTASRRVVILTWVMAILVVACGYWFFLESILDVRNVLAATPPSTSGTDDAAITWKSFSREGLEEALKGPDIVFVDFTADWCLTCKVNERVVFRDQTVIEKFKSHRVVAIRADWTSRNPEITNLLRKFGRSGVPVYAVFPPGNRTEPVVLPEVITPRIVLDALDAAAGVAASR